MDVNILSMFDAVSNTEKLVTYTVIGPAFDSWTNINWIKVFRWNHIWHHVLQSDLSLFWCWNNFLSLSQNFVKWQFDNFFNNFFHTNDFTFLNENRNLKILKKKGSTWHNWYVICFRIWRSAFQTSTKSIIKYYWTRNDAGCGNF